MQALEKLVAEKKWAKARALIQEELLSDPTDHFLWSTLGLTYFEQRQYDKALKCSKRAVELAPNCPLVLWDYAGTLFMCGRESSALAIWTLLLEMDFEEFANDDCSEGMDWALQVINDVHYKMGKYYEWKGDEANARVSYEKYLHNRAHDVASIYDADDVRRFLGKFIPLTAPAS